ncbi:hypothetical protein [Streptomyces sp. NRRL F-5135]|uniref:hypothetical protein n=1 Tax=Streptomyces sp. NRRL F-5135 TaxID=1463858 RepID=UPI0004C975A5|nr:hypothetical protein [Streptomyces sp. NRRL F-5135]
MIERLPVTAAVADLLATATSIPVGRGRMPLGGPQHYYLLYAVDSTVSGAPFADEHEDASFVYQVTSVSAPAPGVKGSAGMLDQVELMADRARTALLGRDPATGAWRHPLVVPGASVMCRDLDTEPGGTSDPADGIMTYVQRFRFDLTPA